MVSDCSRTARAKGYHVLILVLMEYGLWHSETPADGTSPTVLILVLMEYGLWQDGVVLHHRRGTVLILVLMEYGLWQFQW